MEQPLLRRPSLWLVILPLALNWPSLSGWLSADPLYLMAGLTPNWMGNGPIPGLPGWIDGNAGITLQALGRLVTTDWKAGIVPWWNPYSGVGMPLAGEMQPAAFFLPFVLLLGLQNGVIYLKIVLQVAAGLATLRLLRKIGLCEIAAVTGAILFQLNGTFAWDADSSSLPIAFLPVFLLGVERARDAARAGTAGGWRMATTGMTYAVLSGFPERAYIDGLLVLCWAALRLYQARGHRGGFALRIGLAGAVSLLLCAPLLDAFISFLSHADAAQRAGGHSGLQPAWFAMLLFPYAYGPIFANGLYEMWYNVGGYLTLPVLMMALLGVAPALRHGVHERGLRLLLAGWCSLALAKTAAVPGIVTMWDQIPLIRYVGFARYASDSWQVCFIILACFALNDLAMRDAARRTRRLVQAALVTIGCAVCALWLGRPIWHDLTQGEPGRWWFLCACGWGFASTALVALAWMRGAACRRTLAGLLMLDAAAQFSVPLLSGTTKTARDLDLGPVLFLKSHAGLDRVFTLGPLPPNYGAFFGIAQINHNYEPVAQEWVDYVHAHLDPQASGVSFNGLGRAVQAGGHDPPEALRQRVAAYEAAGVKYVLAPRGSDPFAVAPRGMDQANTVFALALQPGQSATGSVPPGQFPVIEAVAVQLRLGTYGGRSTGDIALTLCAGGNCANGTAQLKDAADVSMSTIALDRPLRLGAGDGLRFTIRHEGGTTPVAVWLWPDPPGVAGSTVGTDGVALPRMLLMRLHDTTQARLAYESRLTELFELPDPAPYFAAAGCRLTAMTRESVHTACAAPSHLLRRELHFPGWRAEVNGVPAAVGQTEIFQQVALPAGQSDVKFSFAPPFIGWAYAALAMGTAILLAPAASHLAERVKASSPFLKKRTKKLLSMRGSKASVPPG